MPTTNPYFSSTTGYSGEQRLVNSLVIEQIAMFGVDLLYMPRENINLDRLLHESTKDVFQLALSIPMYIKSFDGYDNSIEILSKFGVRSSDELTLIMSRSQWTTYYAPYVKRLYNNQSDRDSLAENNHLEGQTSRRPKEGDLIYFPFDDGIFEIKYVQFDQPFFQLGKGYIFELQCEKFEYSGEDFKTGIPQIDEVPVRSEFPNLQFTFQEGGTGTFQFQETVRIFDLTGVEYSRIVLENGETLVTANGDVRIESSESDDQIDFQLYNDAGLIRKVPHVEATVATWNIVTRQLSVSNVTDIDPEQIDRVTGNTDINKFDTTLVVGQTSGATWTSINADQKPKAFDDAAVIQEEFNQIKVYDQQDVNPFDFY
jgi:hypothetical protein